MKNSLFLIFSQRRVYWKLRSFILRIRFSFDRAFFRFRRVVMDETSNVWPLRELLRITKFQLLLAVVSSITLQIIDPYFGFLHRFAAFKLPGDDAYISLYVTISGIGGVFIGLYYAAISTVGGAIYSRVPNNIRDLLARERIGNVYMRYLAFLTFLSLCIVGQRLIGFSQILMAVPLITLMAGIGIIAFVKLGQRAFYLFDPTHLSYVLFDDLWHLVKRVTAGGFKWNDPSFQNHSNKLARQVLDALSTLASTTAEEAHLSGRPFVEFAQNILGFLINYENSKNKIPSESRWYEQRYIHKDWYLTADTTVSLAHRTGITLQPEITSNKLWVEDELFPIILTCFKINLNTKRYDLVLHLLGYFTAYLGTIAKQHKIVDAFERLENLSKTVFSVIAEPAEKMVLNDEVLEHLAIAERLSAISINILLSYSESVADYNKEQISNYLRQINWQKPSGLYRGEFKANTIPRLEWFKPRLGFEVASEGKLISPL